MRTKEFAKSGLRNCMYGKSWTRAGLDVHEITVLVCSSERTYRIASNLDADSVCSNQLIAGYRKSLDLLAIWPPTCQLSRPRHRRPQCSSGLSVRNHGAGMVATAAGLAAQVTLICARHQRHQMRWRPAASCSGSQLRLSWMMRRRSLFFKKEMELSLIGLQNAGKTSLVNTIATNAFHEDMIPTVGFNMRKVTKGAVTIKLWDLGGQVTRLRRPLRHIGSPSGP